MSKQIKLKVVHSPEKIKCATATEKIMANLVY